ncbi:uncharacterized protein conserved in bacteria [Calderihabitans maritimus]|uniref:Uncharacterized protein conserved in bacteria n=1 Tax=Calderihabitans maritimus TaxID=1246530 RepID=A0A1Z5HUY4_9FIRM|nr:uncharacterized protein conserved in bacteria [Calderihabitans maritimus]
MSLDSSTCIRCGQSLRLAETSMPDQPAVFVPGKGELCAECYRELSPEEYKKYFP